MKKFFYIAILAMLALPAGARKWTLRECLEYASQNNISLKKNLLSIDTQEENILKSREALKPSLDFSTTHTGSLNPIQQSELDNRIAYNGNYGLNASWTVWNGNRNRMAIQASEMNKELAQYEYQINANSIQEQIIQLYVQILYTNEQLEVNKKVLEISEANYQRGVSMYEAGSIAKADLAQLQVQVANDKYSITNVEGQLKKYKTMLKLLLELNTGSSADDFDVAVPTIGDMPDLPSATSIFEAAKACRPEIQKSQKQIEAEKLQLKIAEAQGKPVISMSGGVGLSHSTANSTAFYNQLRNNFNANVGVNVNIPILDNRSKKTAVNLAKINILNAQLSQVDAANTLWKSIDSYWVEATTNKARYESALVTVESNKTTYSLLSEQFRLGMKNITELNQGKANLLNALQTQLESKYLAVLYYKLLDFYQCKEIDF